MHKHKPRAKSDTNILLIIIGCSNSRHCQNIITLCILSTPQLTAIGNNRLSGQADQNAIYGQHNVESSDSATYIKTSSVHEPYNFLNNTLPTCSFLAVSCLVL